MKSQFPNTKFQIILKKQYPMTKPFINIETLRFTDLCPGRTIQPGINTYASFVWNFEFGSLGFI
jgi:hypothetical protein